MKKLMLVIFAVLYIVAFGLVKAYAEDEAHYRDLWCGIANGETEVRNSDGTWTDCLTETHAIEFDFAGKWYEAVGQSLHYASLTGKEPGIVLIIRPDNAKDVEKHQNLINVITSNCLRITVWTINY